MSDTEFSQIEELSPILDYFSLGLPTNVRYIDKFANKDYFCITEKGQFFIKIFQERQSLDTRLSEVDYVEHLSRQNLPVPAFVQAPNGSLIFHNGEITAMVQEGIAGSTPEITVGNTRQIGKIMGRFHKVPPKKLHQRYGWFSPDYIKDKISKLGTDFSDDPIAQKIISVYKSFNDFRSNILPRLPTGIIHSDIRPSNTIFDENKLVAVVDWEDAIIAPLLLDFSIAVGYWCFKNGKIDPELYKALFDSYSKERTFTEIEIKHLADCIRYVGVAETAERYVLWGKDEGYDALWALGLINLGDLDLKI